MMQQQELMRIAGLSTARARNARPVLKRLLAYLAPHRGQFLLIFVLVVIGAATQAAGPWLIGRAFDQAIGQRDAGTLHWTMLALFATYVVGFYVGRTQFRLMGTVGQYTLAAMRTDIFKAVQRLSLRFFDKQPAGDLMSRLVNDTDVLNQLFSQGLVQVLASLFGLIFTLGAMFFLDWRLAFASFAVVPLMVLTTWAFARASRKAFRKTRASIGDVSSDIQEEIASVKVAQAFNRTGENAERFRARNAANRDANIAATAVTSAFVPAIDVLSTLALALVGGYGTYLAIEDGVSLGIVVAMLGYVQLFFRPVQILTGFYTTAQAALAASERIFELVDAPADITDAPNASVLPTIVGRVELAHVSFTYGDRIGQNQLEDVSLVVEPGQTVAIVGPTGAGKTTLVNLIGRFYDANAGAVKVDGCDVKKVTRASLRSQMGVVLQDSFLFSGTIADNIRYGRLDATDAEVEAAARAANAHELIERLPEKYATLIGERGGSLSQGQRQLIAIARALLANPRILILDEATASVDTRSEVLIQRALATLLEGRTSFVIAHRLSTIRDADLVLVMDHGRIVERGTHETLLASGGLYAELYARQFVAAAGAGEPVATPAGA